MANTRYYLGPWRKVIESDDFWYWGPPENTKGLLDFGNLSDNESLEGDYRPVGLFCVPVDKPGLELDKYDLLGTGDCREIICDQSIVEKILGILKIDLNEYKGKNLAQVIFDLFMLGDPVGDLTWRPLVPTHNNIFEIVLKDHLKIYTKKFEWGKSNYTNKLRDVLRSDLIKITEGLNNETKSRKVLGAYCRQYKCDFHELLTPGKVDFEPLDPTTVITESFNKSDSTILGPDHVWNESGDYWEVDTNAAQRRVYSSSINSRITYCDTNLSDGNQHVTVNISHVGESGTSGGPIARIYSLAPPYYFYHVSYAIAGDGIYLYKCVNSSFTLLDSDTPLPSVDYPEVLDIITDGSTQTAELDSGDLTCGASDSVLPGYVAAGIYGNVDSDYINPVRFDSWSADDGFTNNLVAAITGNAAVVANIGKNMGYLNTSLTGSGLTTADITGEFIRSAGNTVQLTSTVSRDTVLNFEVTSTLNLTQDAVTENILNIEADNTLALTQKAQRTFVETASSTLNIAQELIPFRQAHSRLYIIQQAVCEVYVLEGIASNALTLTSIASKAGSIFNLVASNQLNLTQDADFGWVASFNLESTLSLNQFAVGTILGSQKYILLQAPYNGIQTSVVLPNPLFGDTENLISNISLRRTMDGLTYTYTKSSNSKVLKYTFRLTRQKALELNEFCKFYNSDEIKMQNWKGEIWKVNIMSNPIDFVQTGRYMPTTDKTDVSLEFEGEKISG